MNILVFNCGSSSLNYKAFESTGSDTLQVVCRGKAHRVGVRGSEPAFIEHHDPDGRSSRLTVPIPDHATAARLVLAHLRELDLRVQAVGHRFVHGGVDFQRSVVLTGENLAKLRRTLPLAPIHNPNSLAVIQVCQAELPGLPEYLTFDTAFHAGLPPEAYTYALPQELARQHHLRKYGFHGLSYQFVTAQAAKFLGKPLADLRLVACHLGTGGSSAVAVDRGRPVDTTMGYSPLAGLMMSTRTGDLDALLPVTLMGIFGYSPEALTNLFNKRSGLLGVSGFSSDIRDLVRAMDERADPRARLAFEMYVHRLRKAIGAYAALLGGMDALIFTDDIGVQNPRVRSEVCQGLAWCGVQLDQQANAAAPVDGISRISLADSRVGVLSVPTDEELVIGQEGYRILKESDHAAG